MPINTHLIVVRVGAESVTDALGGGLLALGLEGRRSRVGLSLELVAEVLGRRLLRVGLHTTTCEQGPVAWGQGGKRTLRAAEALSVKDCLPVSDIMIGVVEMNIER